MLTSINIQWPLPDQVYTTTGLYFQVYAGLYAQRLSIIQVYAGYIPNEALTLGIWGL